MEASFIFVPCAYELFRKLLFQLVHEIDNRLDRGTCSVLAIDKRFPTTIPTGTGSILVGVQSSWPGMASTINAPHKLVSMNIWDVTVVEPPLEFLWQHVVEIFSHLGETCPPTPDADRRRNSSLDAPDNVWKWRPLSEAFTSANQMACV